MSPPRTPEQRARYVRSTASDLDVAPDLAERLLFLSESSRQESLEESTRRELLDSLLDDELCQNAWWVAATEGEPLWQDLLSAAVPPYDVGPAVLLAVALARRGAADGALRVLEEVVRPGEFRRSAVEMLADLAEDAGRPVLAWTQVERLGLAEPDAEWSSLRCVLGCSARRQCERARLTGVMHARWLRDRLSRWSRRPWSSADSQPDEYAPPRPKPEGERWQVAIATYLSTRSSVLPLGEQELLRSWLRVRRTQVTVLETAPWQGVVLDDTGVHRTVGWETNASSYLPIGSELSCWLLPTLVPAEHLLVRWMVPAPW